VESTEKIQVSTVHAYLKIVFLKVSFLYCTSLFLTTYIREKAFA
jgi:hypothetical protein